MSVARHGTATVPATEYNLNISGLDIRYLVDDEGRVLGEDVPAQRLQVALDGWSDLFVDPTTRHPELSQPNFKTRTEPGLRARMRGGVKPVADAVLPDAAGTFPTILVRTPYGRAASILEGDWWARRGYVFIAQDCRGRHDSGGEWEPMAHERKDGYDTISWIAKQPWSDGKVGMIGGSYGGYVQWAAAVEHPAALKCIVPQVSRPDAFFIIPYDHGVFFLWGDIWWANIVRDRLTALERASMPLPHPEKLTTLPLSQVDRAVLGSEMPFFRRWLEKDRPAAFEDFNYEEALSGISILALHISGWWDGDGIGTRRNWQLLRAAHRPNQWLIYGPWPHAFNSTSKFGDMDYGPDAILELDSLYLRWFDTWLKGNEVGLQRVPRVRAFLTGANESRDLDDWPDTRSADKTLFPGGAGPANGKGSLGELLETPARESEPDRYTYNPAAATVSKEYLTANPDEATTVEKLEERDNDRLFYRTGPLKQSADLAGPISLDLYFSTTARDTDFFAMLVDEDEKGVIRMVGIPGKIAGRFVQGWSRPLLLAPGRTYHAIIELCL
jgi:putative CocE/NonD family hydrolase